MRIFITIILLISLLLPIKPAVGFEEEAPELRAFVVDVDTDKALEIGTKNILVTIDIPTYIFEEEGETLKVDLRVIQAGEVIFVREDQESRSGSNADSNAEGRGRTKTDYLFALDSPLEEPDKVEMCFTLLPSGRGARSSQAMLRHPADKTVEGRDIAELMLGTASENLELGDLVAISREKLSYGIPIVKTSRVYQKGLIGIISGVPAIILGQGLPETDDYKPFPLALTGTTPVKVSAENGPVEPGDPITSSSVAGVGMKATLPGPIIGTALEGFSGDDIGTIMVIISLGWYPGDAILYERLADRLENLENQLDTLGLVDISGGNATSTLVYDPDTGATMSSGENLLNAPTTINSSGNIVSANPTSNIQHLTSNLNMSGFAIFNVGRIVGLDGKWSINEEGDFVTEGGIYAKEDIKTEGVFGSIIKVSKSVIEGIKGLWSSDVYVAIDGSETATSTSSEIVEDPSPDEVYKWFEGNMAEASRLDVVGEDEESVSYITYGLQSSRAEIVISGSGRLTSDNSQFSILNFQSDPNDQMTNNEVNAVISFDASFTAVISEEEPIKVIVTPTSRINGSLYVAEKSIHGFVVKELHAQDEGAKFDWVVIARRRGYEDSELSETSDIPMLPVEPASSADEPETVIDSTPILGDPVEESSASNGAGNNFTFHCTINDVRDFSCTFQCQVNNQGFVPCESPKNYGTLLPGEYIFKVYAVNSIGEYDHTPAEFSWTVASELEPEPELGSGVGDNATTTPAN